MALTAQWQGTPHVKGSSESMRMVLLTFSLIGLQFTWGTEMTYCTPYLLQLGLTKSKLSLVWIAGPLSGLIMQPIVGIMADKSTSEWGRRRPVMVVGTVIVSICLLVLGWTKEIVAAFVEEGELRREATIFLAVLSIYALDFAINAVQSSCRSLIVDTLPIPKQQLGSAWASRMVAVGHLIGYGAGALDLGSIFGTLIGDTQFKQLTVIAAVALIVAIGVTCWAVDERVLIARAEGGTDDGIVAVLVQIFKTTKNLPKRIQMICWIQFWSWIGWFPFLFYSTTWVGEIYLRYDASPEVKESKDPLSDIGRVGSMSLIVFSIVTFIGSITLPWMVKSPEDEKPEFTPRPPASIAPIVKTVVERKPSLLTAWTVSHLIFAGSMVFAPFVTSLRFATVLVAVCGIPWALACWAPFTFMGVEINKLGSSLPTSRRGSHQYQRVSDGAIEMSSEARNLEKTDESATGELAGIYLGILNLYTTLPQFIATGISMVVFTVLEPGKSPELAKDAHPDEHHKADSIDAMLEKLLDGGYLPTTVIRAGIRQQLRQRLTSIASTSNASAYDTKMKYVELLRERPIAIETAKANTQHYEVGTGVLKNMLGPNMKYSCCLYEGLKPGQGIGEAEVLMLEDYVKKADLKDGMTMFDLGCGWGSLSLFLAKKFPNSKITGFSNSRTQKEYIDSQARERGLSNLTIVTGDISTYEFQAPLAGSFDRVLSIELFEHMKNYKLLLAKVSSLLKSGGKLFVHIFAHKDSPYDFEDGWMTEHFFTGGTMPSADLLLWFQDDLKCQRMWWVNGKNYAQTCEDWLSIMNKNRQVLWPHLEETYGKEKTLTWFHRWQIFYLACAELFAYNGGEEWGVCHYLFEKA
ncbi:sucrose transport protein [Aureobasidium subglaciale]|nr:sucrose transport protein [Aureobasidium subglaciale]KAI5231795.1 sucrose transport protein [Aureobasidium subglaciale]KAI5234525.1 sucrose transport protein [Aureobasidium subglaciale]KAI5268006.1 sucrose transport protein [Aureobasidium subglaciale]